MCPRTKSLFWMLLIVGEGCAPAAPIRATWEYVELTKAESGEIHEVGGKHTLRSGGDEMYPIQGKSLDVLSVNLQKAKFRFWNRDTAAKNEAELRPGETQDLWSEAVGVRLRVDKIGSIPD